MTVSSARLVKTAASDVLVRDIIARIEAGTLAPGAPIRSTSELASEYGIPYQAVHKALQQLARDGYCVRISRKGTFVNERRAAPRVSAVGIPARFEHNPFHARMIEELTLRAAAHGIKAVVGRNEREPDFIERLVQNRVEGVIRFPFSIQEEPGIWRLLQERNLACVAVNDFWLEGGPFPSVRTDDYAGVMAMTEHLISLGHERILFVDSLDGGSRRARAFGAYQKSLITHGLADRTTDELFVGWHQSTRSRLADDMLQRGTAAIVMYDLWAVQLMEELQTRGVVVGRDFSLAGFDGTDDAERCGLSTVVQPVAELVDTAYRLLEDPRARVTPKITLKPTCVFRASTGPAGRAGALR